MDYRKSEYDKAVFASDIKFKNVDYPIRAGYYFNPTGTYTLQLKQSYKTSTEKPKTTKNLYKLQ